MIAADQNPFDDDARFECSANLCRTINEKLPRLATLPVLAQP